MRRGLWFLAAGVGMQSGAMLLAARALWSAGSATAPPLPFSYVTLMLAAGSLCAVTGTLLITRQSGPGPADEVGGVPSRWRAAALHLTGLLGYAGIPAGQLLGPLWCWRHGRSRSAFIDRQGREALNFQILMTLFAAVAWLLCLIFVGVVLLAALTVFHITWILLAALRAGRGRPPGYPLRVAFIGPRAPAS